MSPATELVRLLDLAATHRDPNPGRSHITGQEHALRCASPYHAPEQQFAALVHDLARPLTDTHHGQAIAEIGATESPTPATTCSAPTASSPQDR